MFTKICANTNREDARLAAQLGAGAVGFVFAKSRRQVTPEQVADIVDGLPAGVEKVGVFSTTDPYEIEHVVACTGLTAAQLHSAYDATMVRELADEHGGKLKIIQTLAYPLDAPDRNAADARFEAALRLIFADTHLDAVLLDAAKSGVSGGLGLTLDWPGLAPIVARVQAAFGSTAPRVILAGGLTPANVAEAIRILQPWGVDVASGVESEPGKKDPAKLRAFLQAVRD